jgi:sigma-B regulation protein RsbU (phosphoserine phosphatase)
VGALAPEDDFRAGPRRGGRIALATAAGAVLVALVLAVLLSRHVSQPVVNLIGFMRKVSGGDLEAKAELRGSREFRALSSNLNQMIDDLRDRLRLRQALNIAMDVQQRLLPTAPPRVQGLDIAGHSTYCDETGGDYYDFLLVDRPAPGTLMIALGDVMGHGVAAALVMAAARAVLRDRSADPGTLAQLMDRLNMLIYNDLGGTRFMTMYVALIDAPARSFRFCSAGHDAAIAFRPSRNDFEEIEESGFPLGVTSGDALYEEHASDPLESGQVIFIGTDGIWETQDAAGDQFGKDRLREVLRGCASEPAEHIAAEVLKAVDAFRGGGTRTDDVTFVVVKVQ